MFDTVQVPYSALERGHEDLLHKAHAAGIGTIVRGGVARGEPGVGRGARDRWQVCDRARLDELRDESETRTAWVRFTLSHPAVDTIIVGTPDAHHLADNVRAA